MAYVTALLAGIAGALLALIAVMAVAAGALLLAGSLVTTGSAGVGAVSVGIPAPLLLIAPLAMVAGFYSGFRWQLRRAARR
jgi:hypothetical protein